MNLHIAFSPCPNDTFIFHAMLHGLIDTRKYSFKPYLDDIETLNQKAFFNEFHITKLSLYALIKLSGKYEILDSGAALGYGCGPLVVARDRNIDLQKVKIAVPGQYTTANLLYKLWSRNSGNIIYTRFDNIMKGIKTEEYDAGVIIHEGRFVYQEYGFQCIVDLGDWWEKETGLPIPLGCIAIRNDPDTIPHKKNIEEIVRHSVEYAFENRLASREYIKKYAQEMDDNVIDSHINLYVNNFSISLGKTGNQAINVLAEKVNAYRII